MQIEDVLPALREGKIVFHGDYAHKIEDGKFLVNTWDGSWMECDIDSEMLICDRWTLPETVAEDE